MTFFDNFDNCGQFWKIRQLRFFFTILTISDNCGQFWQLRQLRIFFDNFDNCFYHFDNWKDNPGDFWHLRRWLQIWQLRTWICDNLFYLTINCDTGQHTQFLRWLFVQRFLYQPVSHQHPVKIRWTFRDFKLNNVQWTCWFTWKIPSRCCC